MVFALMGLTAAFFALLYGCCMRIRVGSGAYRALARGTGALWALILLSCFPGVRIGVNLLNVLILCCLGTPGAVLLQVIARMP